MFFLNELLDYINKNGRDTTYSKIIIYLLTHKQEIQHLTISQVAEKCFVSPATLTRFCQHFKIPSFSCLRKALASSKKMNNYNSLRMNEQQFLNLQMNPRDYLESYAAEINAALEDVLQTIKLEEVDQLLDKIHLADEIIILGYSSTLELARSIQTVFTWSKKMIFIAETDEFQRKYISQVTDKSIVITISSFGTILSKNIELITEISNSPATSLLFTQQTENLFTNLFDFVVRVTKTNYVHIGNYPLTFFGDYLIRRYISLYS